MVDVTELEFKFSAEDIKLSDFDKLMRTLPYIEKKLISSFDYYFVKEGSPDEFQRYRESERPELTKKIKTSTNNNYNRVESDLFLDPSRITLEQVEFHVGLDGYKFNFKIFKACSLYVFENTNAVYYVCFDEEMNRLGSYIEIELNKDKVCALGNYALEVLNNLEKELEPLGISYKNRMKRSLFEIYRR